MADGITVTVDDRRALAKLNALTPRIRDALRGVIPDLTRQLGTRVDRNLDAGLKSRTHIQVKQEFVENPTSIYGRVSAVWTGDARAKMVPAVLESGSKEHDIVAVNAKALSFFWERVGKNVMFKRVHHPGFAGIHYMQNAFDQMKSQISQDIRSAVTRAAREIEA